MLAGWLNVPSSALRPRFGALRPLLAPKDRRNAPCRSKSWMRFEESDTRISSFRFTLTSSGDTNCPSPVPCCPNSRTKAKLSFMSKTCTRWFPESQTRTWPCSVSPRPFGNWNSPAPAPVAPTDPTWRSSRERRANWKIWSLWFSRSETTTRSKRSATTSEGVFSSWAPKPPRPKVCSGPWSSLPKIWIRWLLWSQTKTNFPVRSNSTPQGWCTAPSLSGMCGWPTSAIFALPSGSAPSAP
mmetsp:Transcript_14570/g.41633  ORF Transcript_14570/g.41633 Transcript_14570/m.41633 type:complete len:241 (-) Transcript_14570:730-1452(-)